MSTKPGSVYADRIKSGTRYATEELLKHERFLGEVYDPVRGDSGIVEIFVQHGNSCFITSADFFKYEHDCTHVVTEPSSKLGVAYAYRALSLVTGKVALLLPVGWMTKLTTKTLFDETPIARIYIITKRLRYRGAMAWFVWEKGYFDNPKTIWI